MPQAQFKVNKSEAEAFAKVWTYKGIVVPIPETSVQFAVDFSNVVLRNFIEICQQQVTAKTARVSERLE